jgi:beta-phosphoglucomutase-like phosphatase (HAD superfamily)
MPDSNSKRDPATIGLIYDVDGVLVDSPHEESWGEAMRRLFEENNSWRSVRDQSSWDQKDYTQEVYLRYAAGKPRRDGARALMIYFDVPDPDESRLDTLYDFKQEVFLDLVDRGDFKVFDDAIKFILNAHARGHRQAVASSSKNATRLLEMVRLAPFCARHDLAFDFVGDDTCLVDMFEANVCGRTFPKGKPAPDIFLGAAAELDMPPADCIVFEDAVSGVRAAEAGAMACVATARLDDEEPLARAGADVVVTSLDQLPFEQLESLLEHNAARSDP